MRRLLKGTEKGSWWRATETAVVRCPQCGAAAPVQKSVAPDHSVVFRCARILCGFHEPVVLDGWDEITNPLGMPIKESA